MHNPVEFEEFYRLLQAVKNGEKEKQEELEWILAEYEHAKESRGPFDELGQIFCHIGVMELYEYVGLDDMSRISNLEKNIWEYLELRNGVNLNLHIQNAMKAHANEHELSKKISKKWETETEEIEINIDALAKYVTDGIIEILH